MNRFVKIMVIIVGLALLGAAVWLALPGTWKGKAPGGVDGAATTLRAPEGYQHEATYDAAGYYMPLAPIQVGQLKLSHIALGARSDFEAWEAGDREGVFGPILIDFDDLASPVATNELGGEGREKTVRILPDRYRLYPGEVIFHGVDPAVGEVTFVGHFDQAALASGQQTTNSGETAALKGDLQIGTRIFEDVGFSFWAGD